MIHKSVINYFKKTKEEMDRLDREYEQMKKQNKEKSTLISQSLEHKIKMFKEKKNK